MRTIINGIIIGLSVATISAAAKSYIDVERLKVRVINIIDLVRETRQDVKDIKKHLLQGE
jgi:hypothetical protein